MLRILEALKKRREERKTSPRSLSGGAKGAALQMALALLIAYIDGNLDDEERKDLKKLWVDFLGNSTAHSEMVERAKEAYRAYGSVTDFKNYQGLPMPEWDSLTEKIREAWIAATDRASVLATAA